MLEFVLGALLGVQSVPASLPASDAATIREGMWVLNTDRSKVEDGKRQIMWIVRSNQDDFVLVIAEASDGAPLRLLTWNGRYDGVKRPVLGAPMEVGVRRNGETINIFGSAGAVTFSEHCRQNAERTQLRCEGVRQGVEGPGGTYAEDYDWERPNPDVLE